MLETVTQHCVNYLVLNKIYCIRVNKVIMSKQVTHEYFVRLSGKYIWTGMTDSGCGKHYARATLDKQSCVITSTLFEMNSTCMRSCDLNFSCLSTSITSPEVSGCQNNKRFQIQYGRSYLHFVSSNFNFMNLWQLVAFPRANQLRSVNFVCSIYYYRNKFIYMNFRIEVIFHYARECLATQCPAGRH